MGNEAERVRAYVETVNRMEPEIAMVDRDAALASIAISLKRIGDALAYAVEEIKRERTQGRTPLAHKAAR